MFDNGPPPPVVPPIILHHTDTDDHVPGLLFSGEPAVAVGPSKTKLWIGDGTVNRLLLSTDPADNPLLPPPAPDLSLYLPLAGGVAMEGPFTLAGDGAEPLAPATVQQLDAAIAAVETAVFPEAPDDGQSYGRVGASHSWVPVLPLSGGTINPGPLTIAVPAGSSAMLRLAVEGQPAWQVYQGPDGYLNFIPESAGRGITLGAGTSVSGNLTAAGNITANGGLVYSPGILQLFSSYGASGSGANQSVDLRSYTSFDGASYVFINNSGNNISDLAKWSFQRAGSTIAFVSNTGQFVGSSDARFKVGEAPIGQGIGLVRQLLPKSFSFAWDKRTQWGFVAQDVRAVIPAAVLETASSEDGSTTLGLDTTPILAALTVAAQQLHHRLAALEVRAGVVPPAEDLA